MICWPEGGTQDYFQVQNSLEGFANSESFNTDGHINCHEKTTDQNQQT